MEDLVAEVFSLARDRICRAHPYLALALERLRAVSDARVRVAAVDGAQLRCNPRWVRSAFLEEERRVDELLFHALAHCLLGHIFQREPEDTPPWAMQLACDFQAAQLAAEAAPELSRIHTDGRCAELARRFGGMRDVCALAWAMVGDSFVCANRDALVALLERDAHGDWPSVRAAERERTAGGGDGLAGRWQRQARCLRRGSGGRSIGREAGDGRMRVAIGSNARQDFAAALRRYAVLRESARDDPDNFQNAWYLYGMEEMGAPLIEPMEYREERRLDALVIVIDTSGSCVRGLTQHFLELTRDILFSQGLFFRRFNLRILQCDAKVQRDDRITSLREFERYIRGLTVSGGGGTDFRPALEHIDCLVAAGELRGLKGVIYFSDGRGIFPSTPPEYEVTFAFLKHRYDDIDVPSWVRRLVIDAPAPRGGEYYEY